MDNLDINAKEKSTLLEASFEPLGEDGILWEKNGVCYGRQAALQKALRKLYEEEGVYLFDTARVSENTSYRQLGHLSK